MRNQTLEVLLPFLPENHGIEQFVLYPGHLKVVLSDFNTLIHSNLINRPNYLFTKKGLDGFIEVVFSYPSTEKE